MQTNHRVPAVILPIYDADGPLLGNWSRSWTYLSMHKVEHLGTTYYFPRFRSYSVAPDFLKLDQRYSILRHQTPIRPSVTADACITRVWGLRTRHGTVYGDSVIDTYTSRPRQTCSGECPHIAFTYSYAVFPRDGSVVDYTDLSWMLEMQVPPLMVIPCYYDILEPLEGPGLMAPWTVVAQLSVENPSLVLSFNGGGYDQYIRWLSKHYTRLNTMDEEHLFVAVRRSDSVEGNFYIVIPYHRSDSSIPTWSTMLHVLPVLTGDLSRWMLFAFLEWAVPPTVYRGMYSPKLRRFQGPEGIFLASYLMLRYPHGTMQIAHDMKVSFETVGKHIVIPIPRAGGRSERISKFWDALFDQTKVARAQKTSEAVMEIRNHLHKHDVPELQAQSEEEDETLLQATSL
jgi:hypothetical protein